MSCTPIKDAERAAQKPAQMCKVRDALFAAGHSKEQLDEGVASYEQPSGYRDRDGDDEQALSGEIPGEGEQHAEDATRGTNGLVQHAAALLHRELRKPGGDDAHQVIDHEAP